MISQKDYENLKEMYDYKRKIEYNKEKTKKRIDEMYKEFNILGGTKEEMFDHFWSNVNYNNTEFDDPPADWVPENQELRLWNE
jgi:hypothetical protein|tara:strand:- start:106 stop:354 length:249 start_codon:yes stop_codon:yes gene_type:complete